MRLDAIGYGAGSRELSGRPNVTRLMLGTASAEVQKGLPAPADAVLIETNLDDMSPELVPDAIARVMRVGALDAWTTPAQMKKGRPGVMLSALARPPREAEVARAMLEETTALGVRVMPMRRYELDREEREIDLGDGTVRVKLGFLDGHLVNVAPEHDDCQRIARQTGQAVKRIWSEALVAAHGKWS
jgi:pyridinium-3,5-bisthiocarboxylic acid mononucleotide nickel chelatase